MSEVRRERWTLRRDVVLLCLTALATAAAAFSYASSERFFYFWDYANYQDMTAETAAAFRASFSGGIGSVLNSLGDDYNRLFTLPLIPVALAVDLSRPVFIVGLAVAYQLPFALAMGAVAAELFRTSRRQVFWGTVWLTLSLPTVWAPTMRGYPDAGGAALMLAAVWLHLRNVMPDRRLWRVALVGVAVGCAVLFRRHYLYGAVTFFAAAMMLDVALVVLRRDDAAVRRRMFGRLALAAVVMGAATTATLFVFGPAFVTHVVAHDYYGLYRSYLTPPAEEFGLFRDLFGSGFWLLSACGWLLTWRSGAARRTAASFVLLFGSLSFLLWVFVVRQWGSHYGYHVTILLVPGLTGLGVVVSERVRPGRTKWCVALWSAAALLLAVNLFASFAQRPVLLPRAVRRLAAARYPPMVRPDYAEMLRLLAYLRAVAGPDAPIYVGGSSGIMNFDILARADRGDRKPGQPVLSFLEPPQVDSRDWYPIEELLKARFVVITTPFQRHLPPSEQDVVRVVDAVFTEGWELASDFRRLPQRFRLADEAEATVFERTRPTDAEAALRLFEQQRAFLGAERPGSQPDWVALTHDAETTHHPQQVLRVRFAPQSAAPQMLLYAGVADWRGTRVEASVRFVTPTSTPVRVTLSTADANGTLGCHVGATQVVSAAGTGGESVVSMPTPPGDPKCPWLLLTVEPEAGGTLQVELEQLSLGKLP